MFALEMLPAQDGDCLLLEYGDASKPRRVLIDAGRRGAFAQLKKRIESLPREERHFELFIVTHIDEDHISGALDLLEARESLGVTFGEIWFNGWRHLTSVAAEHDDRLGGVSGERLTGLIVEQGLPWNRRFDGKAVMIPDSGPLPVHDFKGLKLTLLTPSTGRLVQLLPEWKQEVLKAGLVPGAAGSQEVSHEDDRLGAADWEGLLAVDFESDTSKPNASSIAVIAEYEGRRVLLGADAYSQDILQALQRLVKDPGKVPLHAFKLPHHGSRANIHKPLLEKLSCSRFLVSTNGSRHKHPNPEALARVVEFGRDGDQTLELFFNYDTEFNKMWRNPGWMDEHHYTTHYPPRGQEGLRIDLTRWGPVLS